MTGRFAIKGILGVSLVFVLGAMSSTASALVSSTTVSGCSLYKKSLGQCSVFVDGILKGLGNVSKNPTAFTATMSRISGQVFCKNPSGNSSTANGTPFIDVEVEPLVGADTIEQAQVTKNGRALSEIVFHDPQIIQALIAAGVNVPDCQNSNWIKVIVVTKMQIMGQQLEDPDPTTAGTCDLTNFTDVSGCTITDTLRTSCRIQDPYFFNPAAALGVKSYNYGDETTGNGACTEICHSTDPTQCNLVVPVHP